MTTYAMIVVVQVSLDLLLRLTYGEVSRSPSEVQCFNEVD